MTSNTARTIAQQLGSSLAMMGAKDLVGSENALRFKVGRGALKGITHVEVKLAADDTYTVCASKFSPRSLTVSKVAEVGGVHVGSLRGVIGGMTGFAMSL